MRCGSGDMEVSDSVQEAEPLSFMMHGIGGLTHVTCESDSRYSQLAS